MVNGSLLHNDIRCDIIFTFSTEQHTREINNLSTIALQREITWVLIGLTAVSLDNIILSSCTARGIEMLIHMVLVAGTTIFPVSFKS